MNHHTELISAAPGKAFCGHCEAHIKFKSGSIDFCPKCGGLLSGLIAYPSKELANLIAFKNPGVKRTQL